MVPQKVFFTKGVGRHKDYLQSFELALRDAGIWTTVLAAAVFVLENESPIEANNQNNK